MDMIILYILLISYILAVNFYAFLLVKSLRDKEREDGPQSLKKLWITGALGGAITIYVCMLIMKFRRTDLPLMVLMPLLGVLNVFLWILSFQSGFWLR